MINHLNTYTAFDSFNNSLTIASVAASAGNVITIFVSGRNNSDKSNFTTPTWNGEIFTVVREYSNTDPAEIELFVLKCVSSGTFNIVLPADQWTACHAHAMVFSGSFGSSFFDAPVVQTVGDTTYSLPSINITGMTVNDIAVNALLATGWAPNTYDDVSSTTHTPNGTQRALTETTHPGSRRMYSATNTGSGSIAISYSKSDGGQPQFTLVGVRLYENGATVDTLGDGNTTVRVGGTHPVSTTGLGDLTTASTVGGLSIVSASAPAGDGTITLAGFTIGQVYPAMGTQTCIMSDGTVTATASRTLDTMDGWQWVDVVALDTGDWSLGKAFSGSNTPSQLHVIDDGVGILNANGTLTNWSSTGTYTAWARMATGGMFAGGEMVSFTFTVTASGVSDTTPDPFTFTDQTNVALSTIIESNTVTISGIDTVTPISVTGGEYAVDAGSGFGAFTSTSTTVVDGDQVKVRHTSSSSYNTIVTTTLTVGGVSDTFTTTTVNASSHPTQNKIGILLPNSTSPKYDSLYPNGDRVVSGSGTDNHIVSGFGTKSSVSKFEDFESRTTGAATSPVGEINLSLDTGQSVTTTRSFSGTKSLINASYATNYFPKNYVTLSGNGTRFYACCMIYIVGPFTGSGIWKMWRIGSGEVYGGEPRAGESWSSSSSLPNGFAGEIVTSDGITSWAAQNQATPGAESIIDENRWLFCELEFYTGTINNSDSYFKVTVDGTPTFIWNNRPYLTTANSTLPQWILLPCQGIDGNPPCSVNWDNIYWDESRARVVYTNNATYTSSTIFNIQPITSYSNTLIQTTRNTPSFSIGQTVHVHIWNATGGYTYGGTKVLD